MPDLRRVSWRMRAAVAAALALALACQVPSGATAPGGDIGNRSGTSPSSLLLVDVDDATCLCASENGTVLVWLNRTYPGWRASVGDRTVPIYRADTLGQAVLLPPGRQSVTFKFAPGIFPWAVAVSLASLACVLGCLVFGLRR